MNGPRLLVLDIESKSLDFLGFDRYSIAEDGTVISYCISNKGKIRKHVINKAGYHGMMLYNKTNNLKPVLVHQLVAKAFLVKPSNIKGRIEVNHKDGNKNNNNVSNLEWISQKDNLHHAMKNGLHDNPMKPVIGWNPVTGEGKFFRSQAEADSLGGFTQSNISKCISGERKICKGFIWKTL